MTGDFIWEVYHCPKHISDPTLLCIFFPRGYAYLQKFKCMRDLYYRDVIMKMKTEIERKRPGPPMDKYRQMTGTCKLDFVSFLVPLPYIPGEFCCWFSLSSPWKHFKHFHKHPNFRFCFLKPTQRCSPFIGCPLFPSSCTKAPAGVSLMFQTPCTEVVF